MAALIAAFGIAVTSPTVILRDGVTMPLMAAGTWQYNDTVAARSVEMAIAAGFRHIDTAFTYYNQKGVSTGLRRSGVARSELFVTTKVPGCGVTPPSETKPDLSTVRCAEDTLAAVRTDVSELGSDYPGLGGQVDLILLHFPPCTAQEKTTCFAARRGCQPDHCPLVQQGWRALERARALNLTRSIGVSNYCRGCLDCLKNEATQPVVNQIQLHLGMGADPQHFVSTNVARGIQVQAWSPLGSGGHGSSEILHGNLTSQIGSSHGVLPAQVALKWLTTKGAAVVTKSSNPDHLRQDLDLFGFDFTQDEEGMLDGASFASADTPSFMCDDA